MTEADQKHKPKNLTKQRRWGKEQRAKTNAIEGLTTQIKNNQKKMTLTPQSHAPAEDRKRPTQNTFKQKKNHKRGKKTV